MRSRLPFSMLLPLKMEATSLRRQPRKESVSACSRRPRPIACRNEPQAALVDQVVADLAQIHHLRSVLACRNDGRDGLCMQQHANWGWGPRTGQPSCVSAEARCPIPALTVGDFCCRLVLGDHIGLRKQGDMPCQASPGAAAGNSEAAALTLLRSNSMGSPF